MCTNYEFVTKRDVGNTVRTHFYRRICMAEKNKNKKYILTMMLRYTGVKRAIPRDACKFGPVHDARATAGRTGASVPSRNFNTLQ